MSILFFHLLPLIISSVFTDLISASDPFAASQLPPTRTTSKLSKPLIGYDDGRIYTCSDRIFLAFENNGSIAWSLHLAYTCNSSMTPVHGGRGKIFFIADNRVLNINFLDYRTSPPTAEVFFGPEKDQAVAGDIIGLAVSTLSSSVYINIKNRGLFAYLMRGQLLWSAAPVLSQFGYRLGCRKETRGCYFTSVPMIDRCEASIYISNSEGELYSLSLRSPHFNWIQDFGSYKEDFTITPGNNGLLYVLVPTKSILLALDVSTGNLLWQRSVGPLSMADCTPVVDSNGWISIGSLDGYLYSISPSGDLNKFSRASDLGHVIQVSPSLDCSGYALYISQAEMEGKVSNRLGDYNYVSAMKLKGVILTLLAPSTGAVYWSERCPGQFSSILSQSDLQHFAVDERILLAFITASGIGNPLACRSKTEQLVSTCSQARPRHLRINTGNERTVMLFLLFESIILVVLAGLVRFCCIFWSKKKLQGQNLGNFLEKRRSLQLKKKEFDRTITELEKKAEEETVGNEVIEELGDLIRERQGIERKLSTTYSLGRDRTNNLRSNSILPVYDGETRSYSFQSAKKESVTIFHTLSDASSSSSGGRSSSNEDSSSWEVEQEEEEKNLSTAKAKAKAPMKETESSSGDDDENFAMVLKGSSEGASSLKLPVNSLSVESIQRRGRRSSWLIRRRALSSTN